ncbi:MAG: hypothetical protein JXB62_07120 [Pirellulales bacterium]|nr:hypothetical protein [Pirellulales bacterium]
MRHWIATGVLLIALGGCAPSPYWSHPPAQPLPVAYDNPTVLPITDHRYAWETVVDVVDDYFRIKQEEPVRLIGETLTAGRLDTFPTVAATVLEPWHGDSVGVYERTESTLQSRRRRAEVQVVPTAGGYQVEVAVFKELEDVLRPEHATAGAATFRYDDTLTRVVGSVGEQAINRDWIPQGRDTALEQRILGQLHERCGRLGVRMLPPVPPY